MRTRRSLWKWLATFALVVIVLGGASFLWTGGSTSFASITPFATTTTTSVPSASLEVVATTPPSSSTGVLPTGPFQLTFNEPIQETTMSYLHTSVAGKWSSVNPYTAEFIPAETLLPDTVLTIRSNSIAGKEPTAANGAALANPINLSWTSEGGSVLRLQQVLAVLGYLPLTWTPLASQSSLSPTRQLYSPPPGTFSWRYPGTPPSLQASFQAGADDRMTQGAMIAFERSHGIAAYSTIRPLIWPVLLSAEASGINNPNGYSYTMVSTATPESMTIWHDGNVVFHTLVNTGLPQTPTPNGTFFVYLRYPTQTMRGTNINGSYYTDHGVKWVNYITGSVAIHGFIRASYGFPQSLGCIELPVPEAAIAWNLLHYGSLVNIS